MSIKGVFTLIKRKLGLEKCPHHKVVVDQKVGMHCKRCKEPGFWSGKSKGNASIWLSRKNKKKAIYVDADE